MESSVYKILIVDDDESFHKDIEKAPIFRDRYEFLRALGTEPLFHLLRTGVQFDLVVLDLVLDTKSEEKIGLTLIKIIKTFLPDTPLAVITNYNVLALANEAIALGADDFIYKGGYEIEEWEKRFRKRIEDRQKYQKLQQENDQLKENLKRGDTAVEYWYKEYKFYEKKDLTTIHGQNKKWKVFISYAHEDSDSRRQLSMRLDAHKISYSVTVWDDSQISPGEKWKKIINENIMDADIIIFLVSYSLLNSPYIMEVELKLAFERLEQENNFLKIIPVILEKCPWETIFGEIQAVPTDGRAVKDFRKHSDGWHEVVIHIANILR